jgi:hypothetical protein
VFSVGDHDFKKIQDNTICCIKDSDTRFNWQVILWWPCTCNFKEHNSSSKFTYETPGRD